MPEVAEVKLTSNFVNAYKIHKFKSLKKSPVSKVKTDLSLPFETFSIESESRGKEMKIILRSGEERKDLKITLGMSGTFAFFRSPTEEDLKHVHLRFETEEGCILGLHDVRRFAKWSWSDFNFSGRGPCPLSDSKEFIDYMKGRRNDKGMKRPASEVLLDQRLFNGIGNYLRAEILYRLDVDPFQNVSDLSEKKYNELIELCVDCAKTSYKLGGGQLKDWKSPTGENPNSFKDWMKCYGKLSSKIDGTGRKFWFHPKYEKM